MSFQAMTWADEQIAGGPSAKATLFTIANFANEHGVAWPSQELLAERSEQSVDSVGRRLRDLAERGLLRRIPLKFAGRKTVDFIVLACSDFFAAPLEAIEPLLPRGCSIDPKMTASSPPFGRPASPAAPRADVADAPADDDHPDAPADCGSAEGSALPQTLATATAAQFWDRPLPEPA